MLPLASEIYVILFIICIGMILLVAGIFWKKKNLFNNTGQQEGVQEELNASIGSAEQIIKEINRYSEYIMNEIETKHKEILFLYQLIDEKEKKLKEIYQYSSDNQYSIPADASNNQIQSKEIFDNSFLSKPSSKQIIGLHSEGKTINEIAKKLDIGKGEVELVLGLAKMR